MLRNLLLIILSILTTSSYAQVDSSALVNYEEDIANADLAYQMGNFKKAKSIYLKLDSLELQRIGNAKKLANIYEQEGNVPKALKYYLYLSKSDTLNGLYFRKVASQYYKARERKQALEYYKKAYALNPKDFLTSKALAEIYISKNDTVSADLLLKEALIYDPSNIKLNQLNAKNAYKRKAYTEVISSLDLVKGKIDFDSYFAKLYGYAYLQIDSLDQSIKWLTRALADHADSENVHYYLSEAYYQKQDFISAKYHLKKAIENGVSKKTGKYYRNLAKIFDDEKNLKEAIPAYEAAYRYDKNPVMLFYLARAYDVYYADKSVAIKHYDKYLKSNNGIQSYDDYARSRRLTLIESNHQKIKSQ